MEHGSLRNLDQIQESDSTRGSSSVGTLVLASIAGACVIFAIFALVKRPHFGREDHADPLAALAENAKDEAPPSIAGEGVSFPNLLSDVPNPTTAMASIPQKGKAAASGSAALSFALPPGAPTQPPAAGDRLPVVPLPAQDFLAMSPMVSQPRDSLTAMAHNASAPTGDEVAKGHPGGYQLQVSSFRKEKRANGFAARLRRSGHHAYVEPAIVPGKGTWYRVRVGPFKNRWQAMRYRKEFEKREHIVTFLVEPPKKSARIRP